MGQHAFLTEPDHRAAYGEAYPDMTLPPLQGCEDGWNMPVSRHLHRFDEPFALRGADHFVLTLHLAGPLVRRTDQDGFRTPGDVDALSLQVPGSGIRLEGLGPRRVDYAHFYFTCGFIDEVAEASGISTPVELQDFFGRKSGGCEDEARTYLRRSFDLDIPPSVLEMDSRAYLIGLGLLRHFGGQTSPETGTGKALNPSRLAKVNALVTDRLSENIRLSEMAEAAGLSSYHFARVFKETTGETPLAFVTRVRLERAVDLLRTTGLPVAHIATQTGFANQSHLARRLKERLNLTATEIRSEIGRD